MTRKKVTTVIAVVNKQTGTVRNTRQPAYPKVKPGCIDHHSAAFGKHPWQTWGGDDTPRFQVCPRCGTQRVAPTAKRLSKRATTATRQLTAKEKKQAIVDASVSLFPDEA